MALFAPIPSVDLSHNADFKDVFDYLEQMRQRKATALAEENKLKQGDEHFKVTQGLERDKLAELHAYHQAKLAMDKAAANGTKKLSAQERTQAMKYLQQGQAALSLIKKARKMEGQLTKNENLTGKIPWFLNQLGMGGEDLGNFNVTAGDVQAAMAHLGSKMGGAQALKWAEKMKASDWKNVPSNLGHVRGAIGDAMSDFEDFQTGYEALTGQPYPLSAEETESGTTTLYRNGKEYNIPNDRVEKALTSGGFSRDR